MDTPLINSANVIEISSLSQTATEPKSEEDKTKDVEQICQWIKELADQSRRENALLQISKRREAVDDLAVWLWCSCGTVSVLLQELVSIYPYIHPPTLTAAQSNIVCNAIALLQSLASHRSTCRKFLDAKILIYLYPLLHTTHDSRPFEYLRLSSLGVIGALVKNDDKEIIRFLLTTEIIPLCLRIMGEGSEITRTVALFILQNLLLDEAGLNHVCQTYERFSNVAMVLGKMVMQLRKDPSPRLVKLLVRCYFRLSEDRRGLHALNDYLPKILKDGATFNAFLEKNRPAKHWWSLLMKNLNIPIP